MADKSTDEDRLFVRDGWRHYRRTYSRTEVRWGLAILACLGAIAAWVAWKGRHPDPALFADGTALLKAAAPPAAQAPAAEGDRGPLPRELAALNKPEPDVDVVLFSCVDDVTARRLIWESTRDRIAFFADGRMAAEVLRVLVSTDPFADDRYVNTLFSPDQAYAGSCTAKSTIYSASIAAGLMVGAFARWLRDLPVEPDVVLNLLAAELTVA